MGTAGRQLGKLDLNRRRDALHQLPALAGQSAKGFTAAGGQLSQSPCDRFAHSVTGPINLAKPAWLRGRG